jgi:hypothetical protein
LRNTKINKNKNIKEKKYLTEDDTHEGNYPSTFDEEIKSRTYPE